MAANERHGANLPPRDANPVHFSSIYEQKQEKCVQLGDHLRDVPKGTHQRDEYFALGIREVATGIAFLNNAVGLVHVRHRVVFDCGHRKFRVENRRV